MVNLEALSADIIRIIVQHLETPPYTGLFTPHARKDTLSLATVCKRMRFIIFNSICVNTHRMEFTFDRIKRTKEALGLPLRKKVQALVLTGSCDEKAVRPTLIDYVEIFPNLACVQIHFVYPHGRPYPASGPAQVKNSTLNHTGMTAGRSLRSVSVSITKDNSWSDTRQEKFVAKVIPHIKASMRAIALDTLDSLTLEIATSRSKEDRVSPAYWKEFAKRIRSACVMPAREVSLEFGEIRMDGEIGKFLDMLRDAIKGWPQGVSNIAIQVPVDDFIVDSKNVDKIIVNKHGRVSLAQGWIPTERMLSAFIETLKKDRKNLRMFRLILMIRSSAFSDMSLCKPVLQFTYAKREASKAKSVATTRILGTKEKPIDVEDFMATFTAKKCQSPEPEYRITFDESVVQELYDAMKDLDQDSDMGGGSFDSYDEFEEEIAMMQERADAEVMSDEEDDLQGLAARPRWIAF